MVQEIVRDFRAVSIADCDPTNIAVANVVVAEIYAGQSLLSAEIRIGETGEDSSSSNVGIAYGRFIRSGKVYDEAVPGIVGNRDFVHENINSGAGIFNRKLYLLRR